MRVRLAALVLTILVSSAGCASAGKPPAAPAADPAEPSPGRANVEVQFLPDPARVAPTLREGQDFSPPHPVVTHLPDYPAGHERTAAVVIVLRFIVGVNGAVREVGDSPLQDFHDPAGDPAFRDAAIDAVRSWVFVPAAIKTVTQGPDLDHDGKPDYTVLVDSQRIPVYLDVRFTFEMVAGQGRVRID